MGRKTGSENREGEETRRGGEKRIKKEEEKERGNTKGNKERR